MDNDAKLLSEAYKQVNERSEQWNVPEDDVEFVSWLKKYHPKWLKGSDRIEEVLTNILLTTDGLGREAKKKALQILRDNPDLWRY